MISYNLSATASKSIEYARELGFDRCSICLDLCISKSVVTKCGHKFCEGCLVKFIDGYSIYKCPVCKNVCKEYTKVSNIHREEKIFRCPIPECDEKSMTLSDIEIHITTTCEYRTVECKCGEQVVANGLAVHEESHVIVCAGCGEISYLNLDDHECPLDMITCYRCKDEVQRGDLEKHNRKCEKYVIACETCGKRGMYDEIRSHMVNCSIVECKDCEDLFTAENYEMHRTECLRQRVSCPVDDCNWNCGLEEIIGHIQMVHISVPCKTLLSSWENEKQI